jgi:hypothetical protein
MGGAIEACSGTAESAFIEYYIGGAMGGAMTICCIVGALRAFEPLPLIGTFYDPYLIS